MTFSSLPFFMFLALVVPVYWALRQVRLQNAFLTAASYVFYAWWDPRFCLLILGSSLLDYFVARGIGSTTDGRKRRLLLGLSLLGNLGLLGIFKYFNFFVDNLEVAAATLGFHLQPIEVQLILPVGISFYTFQTLSYTIDVYRGHLRPTRDLVNYLTYVSFFPQLVAGPIERGTQFLPQVERRRHFDADAARDGAQQLIWGLFKKVVLADELSLIVDDTYGTDASGPALFLATVAFAFQIYFDFSAYSDIAIGTARLLGFRLMRNFAYPYFSQTVGEFWRRWHISLSTWFRDYLFIPLGGSRVSAWRGGVNALITFIVSGFWHGPAWNYVYWGALNGLGMLPAFLRRKGPRLAATDVPGGESLLPSLPTALRMLRTFLFVLATWVFFRASSTGEAFHIIKKIAAGVTDTNAWSMALDQAAFVQVVPMIVFFEWLQRRHAHPLHLPKVPRPIRWVLYTVLFWLAILGAPDDAQQFIYFQF